MALKLRGGARAIVSCRAERGGRGAGRTVGARAAEHRGVSGRDGAVAACGANGAVGVDEARAVGERIVALGAHRARDARAGLHEVAFIAHAGR